MSDAIKRLGDVINAPPSEPFDPYDDVPCEYPGCDKPATRVGTVFSVIHPVPYTRCDQHWAVEIATYRREQALNVVDTMKAAKFHTEEFADAIANGIDSVDSIPKGQLSQVWNKTQGWINKPDHPCIIVLTGKHGRGKSYLAHILCHAVLKKRILSRSKAVSATEWYDGYNNAMKLPDGTQERLLRAFKNDYSVYLIEEFGKKVSVTSLEVWRGMYDSWIQRKCFVILITNASLSELKRAEINAPGKIDSSAPLTSRLMAKGNLIVEFTGGDKRQEGLEI